MRQNPQNSRAAGRGSWMPRPGRSWLPEPYTIRRCSIAHCNRAIRDMALRSLTNDQLIRLAAFEEATEFSAAALGRCVRCERWFLRLRYSRLPLPPQRA